MNDLELRARLFAHLHRGGVWAYYWTLPDKQSHWHAVASPNGSVPRGAQVFFGVHPTAARRRRHQRARAQDICAVNCLFAEFDDKDFGGDASRTLAHIQGLPLPPSALVCSGGGYHSYWLLDQPFVLQSEAERDCIDRLQKAWVAFAGGDDGAKDLARVLRVPGTLNAKYQPARPVTFHSASFDLYDLADLEAIAHPVDPLNGPPAEPADRSPRRAARSSAPEQRLIPYARAALDGELARVRAATAGTRNTRLNYAAYALGQLIGAGALATSQVESALQAAAEAVGLPAQEAQRTIASGVAAGRAHPRPLPPEAETARPGRARARSSTAQAGKMAPLTRGSAQLTQESAQHTQESKTAAEAGARAIHESACTDTANAARFALQHGERARYVAGWGWMIYDGRRWKRDDAGAVLKLAKRTARSIYSEAADAAISDLEAKQLSHWADTSLSRTRLEAMIALAQPELPAPTEDFDRDPYLFNCMNGTLDLRTGALRPHAPADLITRLARASYDPAATCPQWLAFLQRVMDQNENLIGFLQRAAGYALSGDTDEHCFFFLHGTGRNGKSTFTETIQAALGDYAGRVRSDTLLLKRDSTIPNDIASMIGARMIVASELPEGRRLDEPLIKDLTGGDTIKARFMHQDFFTFVPQAKIWMFGNHKPNVRGTDEGIWSRVKLIPFAVTIPASERDPKLKAKLIAGELPGILAWMAQGCQQWLSSGLRPPPEVAIATEGYRAEMDLLAQFLLECCSVDAHAHVTSAALYAAYSDWAGSDALNKFELGRRLKERGFASGRAAKGVRTWQGLGLLSEEQPATFPV